jgi:hypothetical protein
METQEKTIKQSVIHADPYKETVEEIIEKCRQKYFSEGCDKFKQLEKGRGDERH